MRYWRCELGNSEDDPKTYSSICSLCGDEVRGAIRSAYECLCHACGCALVSGRLMGLVRHEKKVKIIEHEDKYEVEDV